MSGKIGCYLQNSTSNNLRTALRTINPAVIVTHLDDKDFLRELRGLAPNAFIVGRVWMDQTTQDNLLNDGDAEKAGRNLADIVLGYKEGAARLQAGGRNVLDAVMGLNEPLGYSDDMAADPNWQAKADRLDRLQIAFRIECLKAVLQPVAFNFGAGNFSSAKSYGFFPRTLSAYRYFGFHEYAWEMLRPYGVDVNALTVGLVPVTSYPAAVSSALQYRECMKAIMAKFGTQADRRFIITEFGLTSMYGHKLPDKGWRQPDRAIPWQSYALDMRWYNRELYNDPYVIGAALFAVAPNGDWDTFGILGTQMETEMIKLPSWPGAIVVEPPKPPVEKPVEPKPIPMFRMPFDGTYTLTQTFGANVELYKTFNPLLTKGHEGLDWDTPKDTDICTVADGFVNRVVTTPRSDPKNNPYGVHVRITHPWGETVYCHLNSVSVKTGDRVKEGQWIGKSGSTGNSTGYHFHFGLRPDPFDKGNGTLGYINPTQYLMAAAVDFQIRRKAIIDEHRAAQVALMSAFERLAAASAELVKLANEI